MAFMKPQDSFVNFFFLSDKFFEVGTIIGLQSFQLGDVLFIVLLIHLNNIGLSSIFV